MESVSQFFKVGPKSIHLPACVFVVNARDKKVYYAWLAEPLIENQSAKLQFPPSGDFHELNAHAAREIINRVKAWYDVLRGQLMPARG